jgi:tetratricopeptide (TPR) repeat protein
LPVAITGTPGPYLGPSRSLLALHEIKTQNWGGITSLFESQFGDGGVPQKDVNSFWLSSYATALIQKSDYARVGELIEKYLSGNEQPFALHLKALYHTHNHRFNEALAELEKLLTLNPEHKKGKELATKLILNRISKNIATNYLDAITADIDLLLKLNPDGLDQLAGASSLKNYLPIVYLKGQQREECARIWEEELRQHPEKSETLHSLAVLYYWWAIDSENQNTEKEHHGADPENLNSLWIKAISHLIMLKYAREFWETWKNKRESAWSRPDDPLTINTENLKVVRNKLSERLHADLQKRFQEYHDKGRINDSDRIDRYIMLLDLEQSSASKFNSFLTTYQDQLRDQPHFEVCGNSMITYLRMRNDMDGLITLARNRFPNDPLIDEMAILMSPLGYTSMLAQRNRLDRAFENYYSLPEQIRQSPDGRTILSRIYIKKIDLDLNSDYPESAVEDFMKLSRDSSDLSLLNKVAEDISRKLIERTNLLSTQEKHQEAIKILEQFLNGMDEVERRVPSVSLYTIRTEVKEHLASFYTNYGWKPMQERRFSVAEDAFMKALKYSPGFQRAKTGLSNIFHNMGVEKLNNDNVDGGITLLEKALSYQDDIITRKNLALAYFRKAAALSHARYAGDWEVLSLLRKAYDMDPSNKDIVDGLNIYIRQSGRR